MFLPMFHHCHRCSHPFLHILAWLGAFLLGWELGRQGFNMPNSHEHFSKNSSTKPEADPSSVTLAEETSGPSEQPL